MARLTDQEQQGGIKLIYIDPPFDVGADFSMDIEIGGDTFTKKPNVLDEAKAKGIDIAPKYIPAEVFDKRAVEKNQVVFHDVSFVEVKPLVKKNSIALELTDFSVFYSQDSIAAAEATLKEKGSKVVVEKGQIVKVSKDKEGIVSREVLTQHWTDWVDYWAVDFDFESKREIIRVQNAESGEREEVWTGDLS